MVSSLFPKNHANSSGNKQFISSPYPHSHIYCEGVRALVLFPLFFLGLNVCVMKSNLCLKMSQCLSTWSLLNWLNFLNMLHFQFYLNNGKPREWKKWVRCYMSLHEFHETCHSMKFHFMKNSFSDISRKFIYQIWLGWFPYML